MDNNLIITKESVVRLSEDEKNNEFIAVESISFAQDVWRRFIRNKIAFGGLVFIVIASAFAILGPVLSSYGYDQTNLAEVNLGPCAAHWFGTDSLGRDLFVRVMYGARISLTVGLAATLINLVIGIIYGGIAGFFGGRCDQVMMRIVDIIYSIPTLLYVLLLTMVIGSGMGSIILAIAISSWAGMARIVRGEVMQLKEQEFAVAARVIGAGKMRILFNHLIKNVMGPIIVTATLNIPAAIFTESFLSFIGAGIAIPKASWGTLCNEALATMFYYPHQLAFPVAAICLTMFSLNFIGDGLADAFDPKRK